MRDTEEHPLFFVRHSSNSRKRIELNIEIRRQIQNKTIV